MAKNTGENVKLERDHARLVSMKLPLHLGQTPDGDDFALPLDALRRHALVLGSSGSGKTIFCKAIVEECLRYGLPVVAIDLQGDILALANESGFVPNGAVPPSDVTRAKLRERMDVKVWTPGSTVGIPVSFAPDMSPPDGASPEDRLQAFRAMAESLARVLGDVKPGTISGLEVVLGYADHYGLALENLNDLGMFLADPPAELELELGSMLPERKRKALIASLEAKMVGINSLFYGMGQPIDVSELFGHRIPGPTAEGRARLSIIYLAHLSRDQQQEFLALLFSSMYRWVLTRGNEWDGVLYFDEIAPFCPPVAKTPAKAPLMMLLRQARKYGLGIVLATQSPGDLDYKALGQMGTMALGRIDQPTARGKVEVAIRSYPNVDARAVCDSLSQPPRGRFLVLNGDHLDAPTPVQGRWIATEDRIISEAEARGMTPDEIREILG